MRATLQRPAGTFVAVTAGTLSNRSRGARPSALMVVEADAERLVVTPHLYDEAAGSFVAQAPHRADRTALTGPPGAVIAPPDVAGG